MDGPVSFSSSSFEDPLTVSRSPRMHAVFEFLRVIRNSESTVLIMGESGTGKEITARLIHTTSRRQHRPFVPVSCALFSETLIESELFGYERGAFTGAVSPKPGLLEVGHRGIVFLDEIGDMDAAIQPKLLKALEEKTFRRLGAVRDRQVDIRLIAARQFIPRLESNDDGSLSACWRVPKKHTAACRCGV